MRNNGSATNLPVIQDVTPKPRETAQQKIIDYSGPRDIWHIRRDNFRALVDQHGAKNVSVSMGQKNQSFVSQMLGPTPTRLVTENTVRKAETAFGLPYGSLDIDHGPGQKPKLPAPRTTPPALAAPRVPASTDIFSSPPLDPVLLGDVMVRVATLCTEAGVTLAPHKQAMLVSTVFSDTLEHGGTLREGFVRQLIKTVA